MRSRITAFRDDLLIKGHAAKGFTLIELLVVVLIIGILAAIAVPQYQVAVGKSKYATLKNMALNITRASERYYLANGTMPQSLDELDIDIPGQTSNTQATFNGITCLFTPTPATNNAVLIAQCSVNVSSKYIHFRSHFYPKSGKITNACITGINNTLGRKICEAESKEKGTVSAAGNEMMYGLP